MNLNDLIQKKWLADAEIAQAYHAAKPFPHFVFHDFFHEDFLETVRTEFPCLAQSDVPHQRFDNPLEKKLASMGMEALSPAATVLTAYLHSGVFLNWLRQITGITEPLISDPYLVGGGYHEIKRGGLLKVHADFNRHPMLNLRRRINLLVYLNKNWEESWGGALELFDEDMSGPIQSISPTFNTVVLFETTSKTYHGHPTALTCPEYAARRSLAYYFYSNDFSENNRDHSTLFKRRPGMD